MIGYVMHGDKSVPCYAACPGQSANDAAKELGMFCLGLFDRDEVIAVVMIPEGGGIQFPCAKRCPPQN
jgi:hypothetical protein